MSGDDKKTSLTSAVSNLSSATPISAAISLAAPQRDSAVVSFRVPLADVGSAISAAVRLGQSAMIALNGDGKQVMSALTRLATTPGSVSARVRFTPKKPD